MPLHATDHLLAHLRQWRLQRPGWRRARAEHVARDEHWAIRGIQQVFPQALADLRGPADVESLIAHARDRRLCEVRPWLG